MLLLMLLKSNLIVLVIMYIETDKLPAWILFMNDDTIYSADMTRKIVCRMYIYMTHIALFPLFLSKFPFNSNYLIYYYFLDGWEREHKEASKGQPAP